MTKNFICGNVPHYINDEVKIGMKDHFSTFDIARILHIKRNTLQPWLDARFIAPTIQKATRRGTKNIFAVTDLYKIELFRRLLLCGISRNEASFYINVNFANVGPGDTQFKYALISRAKMEEGVDSGIFTDISLTKEAPKVVLKGSDVYGLVLNLLTVKEDVDRLIKSRG